MTSGQIITTILVFGLLGAALWLSYKYGYAKGINDLTEEIDEGIRKLKEQDDDTD